MRVLHIITSLGTGGGQTMLVELVRQLQQRDVANTVISLTKQMDMAERLAEIGATVHSLDLEPGSITPKAFLKLTSLMRTMQPDVVQTWLYHADFVGGLAAKLSVPAPIVWNIQHTLSSQESLHRGTWLVTRMNVLLSHFVPTKIICCADSARASHIALGFAEKKMAVIPNGFNLEFFHANPEAYLSVRDELNINRDTPLIGLFARYHPQKDHLTFFRAARELVLRQPNVHFLLAGEGISIENMNLATEINASGSPDHFHLLGRRSDIPRLTAALDIASTSAAFGEGLPLVIGEAMACEVPVVGTDVGDSRRIVAATGCIVPPKDWLAMADAWEGLLNLSFEARRHLGGLARERIQKEYNATDTVKKYLALYRQFMKQ